MNFEIQEYVKHLLNSLREILSDTDIRIDVDYNDNDDGSLKDILFTLIVEDKTEFEIECIDEEIDFKKIEKTLMSVLAEIKMYILREEDTTASDEVILAEETDAWYGTSCRVVFGIFKSKLLALLEIMLDTNEILIENSGGYKSAREFLDKRSSFDGYYLTELIINEKA